MVRLFEKTCIIIVTLVCLGPSLWGAQSTYANITSSQTTIDYRLSGSYDSLFSYFGRFSYDYQTQEVNSAQLSFTSLLPFGFNFGDITTDTRIAPLFDPRKMNRSLAHTKGKALTQRPVLLNALHNPFISKKVELNPLHTLFLFGQSLAPTQTQNPIVGALYETSVRGNSLFLSLAFSGNRLLLDESYYVNHQLLPLFKGGVLFMGWYQQEEFFFSDLVFETQSEIRYSYDAWLQSALSWAHNLFVHYRWLGFGLSLTHYDHLFHLLQYALPLNFETVMSEREYVAKASFRWGGVSLSLHDTLYRLSPFSEASQKRNQTLNVALTFQCSYFELSGGYRFTHSWSKTGVEALRHRYTSTLRTEILDTTIEVGGYIQQHVHLSWKINSSLLYHIQNDSFGITVTCNKEKVTLRYLWKKEFPWGRGEISLNEKGESRLSFTIAQ
ncbi:MAG: hypothetical protein WCY81_01970 [Sphaerochaetaceae bacterium]